MEKKYSKKEINVEKSNLCNLGILCVKFVENAEKWRSKWRNVEKNNAFLLKSASENEVLPKNSYFCGV